MKTNHTKIHIEDKENTGNRFSYINESLARETIYKIVEDMIGTVAYEKFEDKINKLTDTSFSGTSVEVIEKTNHTKSQQYGIGIDFAKPDEHQCCDNYNEDLDVTNI